MSTTLKEALADSANVEDINATGFITGVKAGVFAYVSVEGDTTVTTAGTYYPVEGTFVNAPVQLFGFATTYTPGIKYTGTKTLYFKIDWHVTASADDNGRTPKYGVKLNGDLVTSSVMGDYAKTATESINISGTTVVELAEGDELQIVLTSSSDGDVITTHHFQTTISEFFD